MSDNLTRYLAISNALQQAYRQACATAPCGNYRHRLNTRRWSASIAKGEAAAAEQAL
jgi:hypothetical protein